VAYLVVVGDITPELAFEAAKKYFGDWSDGPVSPHKFPAPKAPQGNVVAFVPMPGAVQSVIDVTYPIDLRPGSMDAIHASVLNNILGGSGFQTRLMQNLREDKAYTYGAYSSISPDDVTGSFSAGASVRNEVTDSSIVQILFEMNNLVNEAVDDTTLQMVKNIMTGSFARSLERPQTVANFALNIEKYKLPKDYYETYLQKLNAVTVADVQNTAKKFLRPENAYITVVGNKDIAPTLKPFSASGKIDMYQPNGSVYVDLKPVPQGVTTATVLQKYIDAIGGEKNIKKVKSFESKGKMDLGEMSMEMNMKVKTGMPGKMAMTVNVMGMEALKQVYDGSTLAMYQMGQKQPDDESQELNTKMSTDLLAEIHYDQYGVKAELKGIEELNDKEYYVIELALPGESSSTEYYDCTTGLKYKSIESTKTGDVVAVSETVIKEYMTTKAKVQFPKIREITAEGQTYLLITNEMLTNPKLSEDIFTVK